MRARPPGTAFTEQTTLWRLRAPRVRDIRARQPQRHMLLMTEAGRASAFQRAWGPGRRTHPPSRPASGGARPMGRREPPRQDTRLAGLFDKLCITVECKSQSQSTNHPNFISFLLEGGPTWSPAAGKRGVKKRAPLSPPQTLSWAQHTSKPPALRWFELSPFAPPSPSSRPGESATTPGSH